MSRRKKRGSLAVEHLDQRLVLDGSAISPAVFFGPTPYTSDADTPAAFHPLPECASFVHDVEDFEDGTLDFGLAASAGSVLAPGAQTDSVDADQDGVIDGFGTAGHSWSTTGNTVTITLPSLMQSAGLVWTDGDPTLTDVVFEAFDESSNSLGTINAGAIADGSLTGETGEDRFFGASYGDGVATGITEITITNVGGTGLEIDHIRWADWSASCLVDAELDSVLSDAAPAEGQEFTWTLTATNNDAETATAVTGLTVDVTIPSGLTHVSDDSGGSFDGSVWTIGSLASGASAALKITLEPTVGTSGSNLDLGAEVLAANETDLDSTPANSATTPGEDDDLTDTVSPVPNTPPVITSDGGGSTAAVDVGEGIVGVTTVSATDVEDDASSTPLSYAISGGADQSAFTIDSASGALTLVAPPSFDTPTDANGDNVYVVQVIAIDSGAPTLIDSQTISVSVTDAPVITSDGGGDTAALGIVENQTQVTTVTATDVEDDAASIALTYSIASGVDQTEFVIDSVTGVLSFVNPPDFESPNDADADNVYEVQISVIDSDGLSDLQSLTVEVSDGNDPPVITSDGGGATASVNVLENLVNVTTVAATDAEDDVVPTPLTYGIGGGVDAGAFSIDSMSGLLTFLSPPNFEAPTDLDSDNTYEVAVTVTDSDQLTDVQVVSVVVTNSSESPTITSDGGGATASVDAAELQTAVTTVTASDDEDDATSTALGFSITSGADSGAFTIDTNGVLTFAAAPTYETPTDSNTDNVYEVEVTVTDSDGLTDVQAISVTVTDSPVITSNGGGDNAATSLAEGQASVTTVTATDVEDDLAALGLTFAVSGGADASAFAIDSASGILSFASIPDFENPSDTGGDNVYDVIVAATDSDGQMDTQAIAVTITDSNDPPVITSDGGGATASVTTLDGQVAVTTVAATDPEQGPLSYSIVGGADQAAFAIGAVSGVLTFNSPPSYASPTDSNSDNVYEVEILAVDSGSPVQVDNQAISVRVVVPPVITSDGGGPTANIAQTENETAVTTVTATDAEDDASQTSLAYSITGGDDAAAFSVDSASGALSFITAPDFETPSDLGADNQYDVIVTVTDSDSLTDSQAIAITVSDADDPPVITSNGGGDTATVNATENETSVTTVTATDLEDDASSTPLAYSIAGGADAAAFTIDSVSGVLEFNTAPNFENPADANEDNIYEVVVAATDSDSLTDTQMLSVSVSDVFDPTIDLEVAASVDDALVGTNRVLMWTVHVTNAAEEANVPATGVVIENVMPTGLTAASVTSSNGTFADGTWSLTSPIEPGATDTLTFLTPLDVVIPADTELINLAYVSQANEADFDSTPGDMDVAEDDADSASLLVPPPVVPAPSVSVDGNVVIAVATAGDDLVELVMGDNNHVLNISGFTYTYDASVVDTFHIGGSTGTNSVRVVGTSLDDVASVLGPNGEISTSAYSVNTYSFDATSFDGGGGNDSIQLYGSNEADILSGSHGHSTLITPDHLFDAIGFERVDAFGRDGADFASLVGGAADDDLYVFPTYEVLQDAGSLQKTKGFERVDATGGGGGFDHAHVFDTAGDDDFVAFPTHTYLNSGERIVYAGGFDRTDASAVNGGGDDRASFFDDDSAVDDFVAGIGYAQMSNANYVNRAEGFEQNVATSRGGADSAQLLDLTSADLLYGRSDFASVLGTNRDDTANGFDPVAAEALGNETPTSDVADIDYVLTSQGDWL